MTSLAIVNTRLIVGENILVLNVKISKNVTTSKAGKRHPKNCRRFKSGEGCRFNKECAYNHKESKPEDKQNELKEMVNHLNKKVLDMTNRFSIETKK